MVGEGLVPSQAFHATNTFNFAITLSFLIISFYFHNALSVRNIRESTRLSPTIVLCNLFVSTLFQHFSTKIVREGFIPSQTSRTANTFNFVTHSQS